MEENAVDSTNCRLEFNTLSLPAIVLQQCVLLVVLISMLLSETHATQAKISMLCANCPSW